MKEHQTSSLKALFVVAIGVAALGGIVLQALRWSDQEKSREDAARRERRTTEQAFRKFLYPNQQDRNHVL